MKVVAKPQHFDWKPYRDRRNMLLAQSDRYTLPDFPISEEDRALVLIYRQQLRDMMDVPSPSQLVFPEWPLTAS